MVEIEEIQALADRIAEEFRPQRIVLFGSYAWGRPSYDSDVDLLVVLALDGKPWHMASEIRKRTRPRFPLDLLVRTPEHLHQRLVRGDAFLEEIARHGKVLCEA